MAIDIALSASVDVGEGAKSLKSLKQEYKEAQAGLDGLTVGTSDYVKQLQKLGKIKDDIGDLNAEIKAFNPEGKVAAFSTVIGGVANGFQAATGAAALFGGESEDLQKTLVKVQAAMAFTEGIKGLVGLGDGFKVLGNIIKANPLFLIVGIVGAIGTALFALKDKIGVVGDAFDVLGDIIGSVVQAGKDFLDFLGLTDFAMQKTADSIIKNSERIRNATSERYDSEIAAAKRAGEETELLEIKKLSAITKTNDAIIAQLRARQQAQGELSDEDKKQLDERVAENRKAYQDILNLSDQYKDREIENQKKITVSNSDEHAKQLAARRKYLEDINAIDVEFRTIQQTFLAEQKALQDKEKADEFLLKDYYMSLETERFMEESEKRKAQLANEKATEQQSINTSLQIAKVSNDSMMALSDLYFTVKSKNLQKGTEAELKVAKQQFRINKALAIQSAIISGIQGVVNALSAQSVIPEPFGTILKVATAVGVGIAAAANVAKIASTQFSESGGGGSVGVASISSSAPSVSAPSVNAPNTTSTQLNPDGTVKSQTGAPQPVIKAQVVETEVTGTQKRVSGIETNAKI